jgi:glycosyltransferase involved in cell wall biosynthesis
MRALNILMLVERYNAVGGIAQFVDSLSAELTARGHRVEIVSTFDRAAKERGYERILNDRVRCRYFEIPSQRPFTLRHLERFLRPSFYTRECKFARLLTNWRPDVINSHLDAWDRYPALVRACRAAGAPLVQCFHVSDARGRGRMGEKGLEALRDAALVACSGSVRDFFAPRVAPSSQVDVIFGGVDAAFFANRREPAQASSSLIFSSGRLELRHKAFDILIEAFALVAAEFPQARLVIAGGGPDRDRIEELIAQSGLRDRVRLAGVLSREQMRAQFDDAGIFALASREGEGLPLVHMEAMGAGLPVVATDVGGAREVIQAGENGYLVAIDDAAAFAAAIRQLLADPDRARKMGDRGRRLILDNYTWARSAARYEELFQACMAKPRTDPKPAAQAR